MNTTPRVTQSDIARGLDALGIRRGEVVYVHSSLSAFGSGNSKPKCCVCMR